MARNEKDGIDRRGALECMIWAGTGVDPPAPAGSEAGPKTNQ
jgi:hypothetical protein